MWSKTTLLSICLLFTLCTEAQDTKVLKGDTLVWKKGRVLVPTDFKGKPLKNNIAAATSTSILIYGEEQQGRLVLYVKAIVVLSQSSIAKPTKEMLSHEQRHFDISEIYARKLRQELSKLKMEDYSILKPKIDKLVQTIVKASFAEQERYEKETMNGSNLTKQKMWDEDIKRRLIQLNAFEVNKVMF